MRKKSSVVPSWKFKQILISLLFSISEEGSIATDLYYESSHFIYEADWLSEGIENVHLVIETILL